MGKSFFDTVGPLALGSRLRMLTAAITEDAKKIYALYGVALSPKWFPVFYVLSEGGEKTVTGIAGAIGHSQPSVSKIVREMAAKGLVRERRASADGRKNLVRLSTKGRQLTEKIKDQYADVYAAVSAVSKQANVDLWKAIDEWENLLEEKSLLQRVKEQRKERESKKVRIVRYEPKYKKAFRALNEEWISTHFKMEAADYKALDNPKGYILDKGGSILVALHDDEPVGVCALLKMNDPKYAFELAKMAVSPKAQGRNIGWLLGQAVVSEAKERGASWLYLESNTVLKPAISLYHKLGFQKIAGRASPYERCNIQMELDLKK